MIAVTVLCVFVKQEKCEICVAGFPANDGANLRELLIISLPREAVCENHHRLIFRTSGQAKTFNSFTNAIHIYQYRHIYKNTHLHKNTNIHKNTCRLGSSRQLDTFTVHGQSAHAFINCGHFPFLSRRLTSKPMSQVHKYTKIKGFQQTH